MNKFTTALQGSVAAKLKEARKGLGISTRAVAEKLSGGISHATIANYEKGESQPTLPILAALAEIYGRPINWFLEQGPLLTGIRYRNLPSRVRETDKHRYEADALRWLEAYLKIERLLESPLISKRERPASLVAEPAKVAESVRRELGIAPDAPIPSVIDSLEAYGIRVIELPTVLRVDGLAAMLGEHEVVVLNPTRSNDRIRLNAAHEFFHQFLGHCKASDSATEKSKSKADEDLAFACARQFLIPAPQLREAFAGESFVKLVKYKEKFGISISAMIYAARQDRVISESDAKFLWIQMSKRGWRENEPGTVRPDRATRFEQLIDIAAKRKNVTVRQMADFMGVSESDLNSRLRLAHGISDAQESESATDKKGDDTGFTGLRLAN